jgi:arsenate reductase
MKKMIADFICYTPCSTCAKARAWMKARGIEYAERNIKQENPTYDELKAWYERSGLPLKRFFNTSGMKYRELDVKSKLPTMSDDEALHLLSTDGMLVKRPILLDGDTVLVGFKQDQWDAHFDGE